MKAKEDFKDYNYRLRQEALQSKDNSKQFRYIGRGIEKIVKLTK